MAETLITDSGSPYSFQGAYKLYDLNEENEIISADVKNSYLQQNLPVRRQSLVAYHGSRRKSFASQGHSPLEQNVVKTKRRSSLRNIYHMTKYDGPEQNGLDNSKSLGSVCASNTPLSRTKNKHLELTIKTSQDIPENSSEFLNSTTVLSDKSQELSMNTLFEEEEQQKQEKQATTPTTRFIGLLRPSKSDTTGGSNKEKKITATTNTENALSHSWNDMTQPLSKLKSVFSRLQSPSSNTSETSLIDNSFITPGQNTSSVNEKKIASRKKETRSVCVYTAMLSNVAKEFLSQLKLMPVSFKDGIEYRGVFNGAEAVSCISSILGTEDRNLSLLVGRALENQDFFHHVNYHYRLRDLDTELYRFQYLSKANSPSYCERPPIPPQFEQQSNRPLLSLKKSSKSNNNNKIQAASFCETLPVNGVFSVLTDCYSPTCSKKTPCYSVSCPRMKKKTKNTLPHRTNSKSRRTPQEQQIRQLWRHSVPLNVVTETEEKERKRQECIYELIYTEQDFLKDLRYIQKFWIQPILENDIIERKFEFVKDVFWNISDIEKISRSLAEDLTRRRGKHSIIPGIGDILLKHAARFGPFVTYGAHQMVGKHAYELERKKNAKFAQFAEKLERQPESRRLELNGYLTKPTSRLGRYNLLLNAILQVTPKDHEDYANIPKVVDMVTNFLVQLNRVVGVSDNKFHLKQISNSIASNNRGAIDLDLLNSHRELILRGKMRKYNQSYSESDTAINNQSSYIDLQVFLFDHYLVFCKIKSQQEGSENYKIYQKPISLATVSASIPNSAIVSSPTTPSLRHSFIYNKMSSSSKKSDVHIVGYPITFHYQNNIPQSTPSLTLFVTAESVRKLWIDAIERQKRKKNVLLTV